MNAATPDAKPPLFPERLGDWVVGEVLGGGAQGMAFRVHRADEPAPGGLVAKVLRPWGPGAKSRTEAAHRARFLREVTTLRSLAEGGCPGIVPVVDADLAAEAPAPLWYVMPFYAAGSLADADGQGGVRVATGLRGNVDRVLEIAAHLARTLAWMHGQPDPIAHRDVHTGNVFLDTPDGPPILGDFGLVHDPSTPVAAPATGSGESLGPWRWRPPEYEPGGGDRRDTRSDIYLLGGVIFECLSGGAHIARAQRPDGSFAHEQPPYALAALGNDPRLPKISLLLRHMLADDPAHRMPAERVAEACARIRAWVPGTDEPFQFSGAERLARATSEYRRRSPQLRSERVVDELFSRCMGLASRIAVRENDGGRPYTPQRNVEANRGDMEPFGRAKSEFPQADWAAVRVMVRFEPTPSLLWLSYMMLGRTPDGQEIVAQYDEEREWRRLALSFAGDPEHDALIVKAVRAELDRLTERLSDALERAR